MSAQGNVPDIVPRAIQRVFLERGVSAAQTLIAWLTWT